jgi:GTP-binding protein EngB required for normal cell division
MVVFLGNHSSGKSTFINHLLNEPDLQTAGQVPSPLPRLPSSISLSPRAHLVTIIIAIIVIIVCVCVCVLVWW